MKYLIKNATVVNEGECFEASVYIADGKIAKIVRKGEVFDAENAIVIDATGKYLIPGLIDEHVHFREPGLTQKADMYTESRAAVAGGVTSYMDMPNTVPQTVTQDLLQQKFDFAAEKSLANYSFYLGATNDNLAEVAKTDPSKVCGIKLFMGSSTGNMLVDNTSALEALFKEAPCLIAAHCEDEDIIRQNTQHYKSLAEKGEITPDACIHPLVRSAEACYKSSAKAVELAEKTGARLHIMQGKEKRKRYTRFPKEGCQCRQNHSGWLYMTGNTPFGPAGTMDINEYIDYDLRHSIKDYWKNKGAKYAGGPNARGSGLIPQIKVGGEIFESIFGSNVIDIRPSGSAELIFGIIHGPRQRYRHHLPFR